MGPFEDRGMVLDWAIDAFVLNDGGDLYLYYAKLSYLPVIQIPVGESVWMQKLSSFTELDHLDKGRQVLTTTQAWEKGNIVQVGPIGFPMTINEGPWVTRIGNLYYLTYSGNTATTVNYDMGYATSKSPFGPFTKGRYPEENPFVQKANERVMGPGHHSIWKNKTDGRYWAIYHQKKTSSSGWPRDLAVDEIVFSEGRVTMIATRGEGSSEFVL
jgi:beta-xylosidase